MKKYDVLIIGSGPAGNTAAIYLVRSGYKVAIVSGSELGGQLTTTTDVENFPGFPTPVRGGELMELMLKQSQNLGVEIIYDIINKVDFSQKPFVCNSENGEEFVTENVIIATGAKAKYLGIESEGRYIGHGISACATCDGNFFKNKTVAVIGGGNTAGIEAVHLAHLASKVYVIYRKDSFFRMEKAVLAKLDACANVERIFNTEVVEVLGQEDPLKVMGIKIVNNKSDVKSEINLDGVFVAIGREPNTALFIGSGLEFDKFGYIMTKPNSSRTNIAGVYAAGDVTNKGFKQAVVAAGWGCIAALEIQGIGDIF
jgi:thioredoxin reductase (NADPH)